jgi:hypothetical protein
MNVAMRPFIALIALYAALTVASAAYSYEEFAYLSDGVTPPLSDSELALTPPPPTRKPPETDLISDLGTWAWRQVKDLNVTTLTLSAPHIGNESFEATHSLALSTSWAF